MVSAGGCGECADPVDRDDDDRCPSGSVGQVQNDAWPAAGEGREDREDPVLESLRFPPLDLVFAVGEHAADVIG